MVNHEYLQNEPCSKHNGVEARLGLSNKVYGIWGEIVEIINNSQTYQVRMRMMVKMPMSSDYDYFLAVQLSYPKSNNLNK